MIHLDLFSGIGGFSLAAKSVWGESWRSAGFCDNEPFSQAIIKKHFPEAKIYDDIKTLKGNELGPVDLITGGFPCQPFSSAGKRRGKEDDRHLWPHMLRVIREAAPRWVIGENVGGLLTWNGGMVLDEVFADLEAAGYEVWAFVIPACAVGAPHRRDRVWIVAHADSRPDGGAPRGHEGASKGERLLERHEMGKSRESSTLRDVTDTDFERVQRYKRSSSKRGSASRGSNTRADADSSNPRLQGRRKARQGHGGQPHRDGSEERASWQQDWIKVATRLCTLDDGLPDGTPRPKGWRNAALKGAGNAIVPQVAAQIFNFIKEIDAEA